MNEIKQDFGNIGKKTERIEFKHNEFIFNKSIIDLINKRFSIRAFQNLILNTKLREDIHKIISNKNFISPFRDKAGYIRFKLINRSEFNNNVYNNNQIVGGILGAQDFIIGVIEKSQFDYEHYGYIFESLILKLTEFGLGTCWLGGFFDRNLFAEKINKQQNEIIPAISPIGTPDYNKIKGSFGISHNFNRIRFPEKNLFFSSDLSHTLNLKNISDYSILLKMVHIGPSASNLQPWRIIKEKNENTFHFFTLHTKDRVGLIYNNFRRIDIGIAVSHFDLTSKFLNYKGAWEFNQPNISTGNDLKYIISWVGVE